MHLDAEKVVSNVISLKDIFLLVIMKLLSEDCHADLNADHIFLQMCTVIMGGVMYNYNLQMRNFLKN